MEWVTTTGKTVEEAKELGLDELGVDADEAEFEILELPRPGLFGRLRGDAKVRSRVRPAEVRPKRDRRRRKPEGARNATPAASLPDERSDAMSAEAADVAADVDVDEAGEPGEPAEVVDPAEVGEAAVRFVDELVQAIGLQAATRLERDDTELDVIVEGERLGLLIGPGGRTLLAIQNLARVAAQRRLGDHDTRLRVDVAGYRAKRKAALEQFATELAHQVAATGVARSLEPMPSADRKIIHDVLATVDGVQSQSVGEDPYRRVIVTPVGMADAS